MSIITTVAGTSNGDGRRRFINANPPRSCRAVPAVLEAHAVQGAHELKGVSGKKGKLREAVIKYDFKGAEPVVTVGARFYRKWQKQASFPLSA